MGVIIDENLSWKNHINYIEEKIAKNIGIIKRVEHCLSEKTMNTLYNTFVLPYLSYCNIVWAKNHPTHLKPLLLLQKRCMRVITNSPYRTHALPLFAKLNQLTIFDLNKLLIATFMFRYHKGCLPKHLSNYFIKNSCVHNHFTRSCNNLHIPHARTGVRMQQLRICGPKLWNIIDPAIIENSQSWHSFKRQFKKQLFSYYVSNHNN